MQIRDSSSDIRKAFANFNGKTIFRRATIYRVHSQYIDTIRQKPTKLRPIGVREVLRRAAGKAVVMLS